MWADVSEDEQVLMNFEGEPEGVARIASALSLPPAGLLEADN